MAIENGVDSMKMRDGRWRWMLYDTDWGFGYTGRNDYGLNLLDKARKTGSVSVIFDGLLKNRLFREQFVQRFDYHLSFTFDPALVINRISSFENVLSSEMPEHINRWRVIGSYEKWQEFVDELRVFAQKRPMIQKQHLDGFINSYKEEH